MLFLSWPKDKKKLLEQRYLPKQNSQVQEENPQISLVELREG